jgi:hypothetical protein
MAAWHTRIPTRAKHFLNTAVLKRLEEQKKYPMLPTGESRFHLHFKFNPEINMIEVEDKPFPNSGRLFVSPCIAAPLPFSSSTETKRNKMTLVVMIRQESDKLYRMIRSFKSQIDSFLFLDTGSTDDTPQRILMLLHDLPGTVYYMPFIDFGTNRTALIQLCHQHYDQALSSSSNSHSPVQFSKVSPWIFLADADYVLHMERLSPSPSEQATRIPWTQRLTTQLDKTDEFQLATVENLEYWRSHIINIHTRKKRYVGRTHEYLSNDKNSISYSRSERITELKINHLGDGKFGAKSNKFYRDLIYLFMDALDGFDLIRSFEYIIRMALIIENYELVQWACKELFAMQNVAPEIVYCSSQQYTLSIYRSMPIHIVGQTSADANYLQSRYSKALSPLLYGLMYNFNLRLETLAELFVEMSNQHEYQFICALGSLFTFNERDPGTLGQFIFVDKSLHRVTFDRYLAFAGHYCKSYQLMSLYLYFENLEKQPYWKICLDRRHNHDLYFKKLYDQWNLNPNGEFILLNNSIRKRLSVLATQAYLAGKFEEAYSLWELALASIAAKSQLPFAILLWLDHVLLDHSSSLCKEIILPPQHLNQVLLKKTFMEGEPLYGFKNAVSISQHDKSIQMKSSVLSSQICYKLYMCSRHLKKSIWEQLAHLMNAWKFWPSFLTNKSVGRHHHDILQEMILLSKRQSHSMSSTILKIVRILTEAYPTIASTSNTTKSIQLTEEEQLIAQALSRQTQIVDSNFRSSFEIHSTFSLKLFQDTLGDNMWLISMYHTLLEQLLITTDNEHKVQLSHSSSTNLHQIKEMMSTILTSDEKWVRGINSKKYGQAFMTCCVTLFELNPQYGNIQSFKDLLSKHIASFTQTKKTKNNNNLYPPAFSAREKAENDKKSKDSDSDDASSYVLIPKDSLASIIVAPVANSIPAGVGHTLHECESKSKLTDGSTDISGTAATIPKEDDTKTVAESGTTIINDRDPKSKSKPNSGEDEKRTQPTKAGNTENTGNNQSSSSVIDHKISVHPHTNHTRIQTSNGQDQAKHTAVDIRPGSMAIDVSDREKDGCPTNHREFSESKNRPYIVDFICSFHNVSELQRSLRIGSSKPIDSVSHSQEMEVQSSQSNTFKSNTTHSGIGRIGDPVLRLFGIA